MKSLTYTFYFILAFYALAFSTYSLYCYVIHVLHSEQIILYSKGIESVSTVTYRARPDVGIKQTNYKSHNSTTSYPDMLIPERESMLWKPTITKVTKVIFVRIPKTGSRTLAIMMSESLRHKGYKIVYVDFKKGETLLDKQRKVIQIVNNEKGNSLFAAHIRHVDLQWSAPPIYVSLARDPVDRYKSHFNYCFFGDAMNDGATQQFVKLNRADMAKSRGGNTTIPTLSECILQDMEFCRRGNILYATLRFLCGYDLRCSNLTEWTYSQAVKHVNGALAVGVTEEFGDYLRVLERLSPDIFKGIASDKQQQQSKTQHSKTKSTNKAQLEPEAEKKLRDLLEMEYRIYNYIKDRFHQIKKELVLE